MINLSEMPEELTPDAELVRSNYLKRLEAFANGAKLIVNSTINPSEGEEASGGAEDDWSKVRESNPPAPTKQSQLGEIDAIHEKYKNYLKQYESDIKLKNQFNSKEAISQFYTDAALSNEMLKSLEAFILELQTICGREKFALSEAWVAWQGNETKDFDGKQKDVTLSDNTQFSVQQKEEFLNIELTDAQIADIQSVLTPKPPNLTPKPPNLTPTPPNLTPTPPKWFTKLPEWAQNQFKKEFFKEGKFLQEEYERYKPPTLRSVPGIVNTAKHVLTVTVGVESITTESYRQGVPVPYDMPNSEKLKQTIENFQQLINYHEDHIKSFWDLYGDKNVSSVRGDSGEQEASEEDLYGAPITHISLLSGGWGDSQYMWAVDSLNIDKDNNTEFLNLSRQALDTITRQALDTKNSPPIASYNWPVNEQRPISPKKIDKIFIEQMENRLKRLEESKKTNPLPSSMTDKHIEALRQVILSMKHHNQNLKRISGRNPNLFAAALMMAAVRLSGGTVVSNCKSGKDREGAAILMADSIISYTVVKNKAPKFDDGKEREDFLAIQEELYLNKAHQAVADRGSPGSGGLKDEGFFEKDFIARDAIKLNFQLSRKIADFNKPEKKWYKIIVKDTMLLTSSLIGVVALSVGIGLAASGVGLAIALPIIAIAAALWAIVAYMVKVPPKPLALPPKPPELDSVVEPASEYP